MFALPCESPVQLPPHPPTPVITVDIFDTALLRTTTPELQRFYQMAKRMRRALKDSAVTPLPSVFDLFTARTFAWRIAYQTATPNKGSREGRLEDILRLMCVALKLDPTLASVLRQAEIDYEVSVLSPNKPLLNQLSAYQAQGTRVYFLSDMYFSESDLHEILSRVAPTFSWDGGYVSSTTGLSKHDRGRLFEYFMSCETCMSANIFHIGDKEHSDVAMPQSLGIMAQHTPRSLCWRAIAYLRSAFFLHFSPLLKAGIGA